MAILVLSGAISGAEAQARLVLPAMAMVNSEEENYFRLLQSLGLVSDQPWSLRGFTRAQVERMAATPLERLRQDHPQLMARPLARRRGRVELEPIRVRTWLNTGFPFGMNDGAVWVGRGITSSLDAGFSAAWGPFDIRIAPTAFWAQNAAFTLRPNGWSGERAFNDGTYPLIIDRPQRFGDSPYGRIEPGESWVAASALGMTLGASTANEWWGPMAEFPFILGNNASGIPRVYFGSAEPFRTPVGRIHGRVFYGSLGQSKYSPATSETGRRFAGAFAGVIQPRGFPGLEVGAARFFHVEWPASGITRDYFLHLFESLIKDRIGAVFAPFTSEPNQSADNQLASVFARWVLASSGFEVYAEYGREDHNWDVRDLILEPDHTATTGFGLRKAWVRDDGLEALRGEMVRFQASGLTRHRGGTGGIYLHGPAPQGHTLWGQLLGANVAIGSGAGQSFIWERIRARSADRVGIMRLVTQEYPQVETQLSGRLERSVLRGDHIVLRSAVTLVRRIGADVTGPVNVQFEIESRYLLGRGGK